MKKLSSLCLGGILLANLLVSPGYSLSTKQFLEKMVEARGGRKVLENINNAIFSGTIELFQFGKTGTFIQYQKEPNNFRFDIEVMGIVITQSAYNGDIAWMTNSQTGTNEELPEQYARDIRKDALGYAAILYPEQHGISYTLKEKEKIKDKEYYVLVQTFFDGDEKTYYIDPITYLPYKTNSSDINTMGVEVEEDTIIGSYQKVDGVVTAKSITVLQNGELFLKIKVTEVSFNTRLDNSLFNMND